MIGPWLIFVLNAVGVLFARERDLLVACIRELRKLSMLRAWRKIGRKIWICVPSLLHLWRKIWICVSSLLYLWRNHKINRWAHEVVRRAISTQPSRVQHRRGAKWTFSWVARVLFDGTVIMIHRMEVIAEIILSGEQRTHFRRRIELFGWRIFLGNVRLLLSLFCDLILIRIFCNFMLRVEMVQVFESLLFGVEHGLLDFRVDTLSRVFRMELSDSWTPLKIFKNDWIKYSIF